MLVFHIIELYAFGLLQKMAKERVIDNDIYGFLNERGVHGVYIQRLITRQVYYYFIISLLSIISAILFHIGLFCADCAVTTCTVFYGYKLL